MRKAIAIELPVLSSAGGGRRFRHSWQGNGEIQGVRMGWGLILNVGHPMENRSPNPAGKHTITIPPAPSPVESQAEAGSKAHFVARRSPQTLLSGVDSQQPLDRRIELLPIDLSLPRSRFCRPRSRRRLMDVDDETVGPVGLPPSPLLEAALFPPSTDPPLPSSPIAAPSSISAQPRLPKDRGRRRATAGATAGLVPSSTIPTPQSSTTDEPSPPHNPPSSGTPVPSQSPVIVGLETPLALPLVDPLVVADGSPGGTRGSQDSCMFCTAESAPPGENLEWIQCNGCKRWAHTLCTGLPHAVDIATIDKFHCKRCEKTRGLTTCRSPRSTPSSCCPSFSSCITSSFPAFHEVFSSPTDFSGIVHPPPRKSERSHVNIDYTSLNLGDTNNILPNQHAYNVFFDGPSPRKFAPDRFKRMNGAQLTRKWAEETGCKEPVVIPREQSEGLEMIMPENLTVRKVSELVGPDTRVEVIGIFCFLFGWGDGGFWWLAMLMGRCSYAEGGTELAIEGLG